MVKTKSSKVFLFISIILLISDALIVFINYKAQKQAFEHNFRERNAQFQSSYELLYEQTRKQMLQLANFVASDPKVQQLFLKGKEAVEREGGGSGGTEAAKYRQALYNEVSESWKKIQHVSGGRQLHFHLGPGSTSFLRVHKPSKYGDNMDDVRHTIVYANEHLTSTTGFETGRIVSGIRGVVPVFAMKDGKKVHVGALETGISYRTIMENLKKTYGLNMGIFLTEEHAKQCLWADYYKSHNEKEPMIGSYIVEGFTDEKFRTYFSPKHLSQLYQQSEGYRLESEGRWYSVGGFAFDDFWGEIKEDRKPVGVIAFWFDITEEVLEMKRAQSQILMIAVFGYLLIEILLFFAIRLATKSLEKAIEDGKEEIKKSNRALQDANQSIGEKNEKLESLIAYKDDLLGVVSHDLKNPINAITMISDVMLDEKMEITNSERNEQLEVIRSSSKHMLNILNNLLVLNKLDLHRVELKLSDASLNQCIEEQLSIFSIHARAKNIELIKDLEAINWAIDITAFKQILDNLVSNAIKFAKPETKIWVRLKGDSNFCYLEVEDEGPGFTEKDREKLFGKFARLSARPTGNESSTGLGLSIAKEFATLMNAEIKLVSPADKSACFRVTFHKKT